MLKLTLTLTLTQLTFTNHQHFIIPVHFPLKNTHAHYRAYFPFPVTPYSHIISSSNLAYSRTHTHTETSDARHAPPPCSSHYCTTLLASHRTPSMLTNSVLCCPVKQIRASMLSGECRWTREAFTRGNWTLTQQFQSCVRKRAIQSVMARPRCKDDVQATQVVNQVWDSCFSDTRPFDEVYR